MITNNISITWMHSLIQRWYEAADKDNLNTDGRMKLYDDTEKAVKLLSQNSNIGNIPAILKFILQQFDQAGIFNNQILACWMSGHTAHEVRKGDQTHGAYLHFYRLFATVVNNLRYSINHVRPAYILPSTETRIFGNKRDFSQYNDIGTYIYSHLNLEDILAMRNASKTHYDYANSILVHKLNSKEIAWEDLGITDIQDLLDFFPHNYQDITELNFIDQDINNLYYQELKKLSQYFPKLTTFTFRDCKLSDLSFLNEYQFLKTLIFEDCEISETISLGNCTGLQELRFENCNIVDLSFLENLKDLKILCIYKCTQIKDFIPIGYCLGLEELDLQSPTLKDMHFLPKNLKALSLECKEMCDFSPLADCPLLTSLTLSNCHKLTGLSFLQNLKYLRHLFLEDCIGIVDFSPLETCPQVTTLSLNGCIHLTTLDFLRPYRFLKELHLDLGYKLTDLDAVEHCKDLVVLTLRGCHKIQSFSALKHCPLLETFILTHCKNISDLNCLENCKKLIYVDLSGCSRLTNIYGLAPCKNLKTLNLTRCVAIVDVSVVQNFDSLQTLLLKGCKGIKVLSGLKQCHYLDLENCTQLEDVSALQNLKLKTLILYNCTSILDYAFIHFNKHIDNLFCDLDFTLRYGIWRLRNNMRSNSTINNIVVRKEITDRN